MDWLHPTYFWALMAVPLVAGLFVWAAWQRRKARRRFGEASTFAQLATAVQPLRRRWKAACVTLGVLLIGVSLAGPRIGTETRTVERRGIDLMIALDVSQSMHAEDVAPNRLERAKNAIKGLLDDLTGDRVGLILFAGDAFIQCPLTTDYNAVRLFLDVAEPSSVATPGTDFYQAFQVGMQAFSSSAAPNDGTPPGQQPPRSKAMLFVSDGENHMGSVEQIRDDARDQNIVLFSAGVGETSGAPIPLYQNGQRTGFKRDNRGEIVNTRLEEDVLTALAQDGAYFRLTAASNALTDLTESLTRMTRTAFAEEEFASYTERYQWPLALALLLLLAERFIRVRRPRSAPA
jgi:Ca-activated chloride channel family protein